ncbi:helix-turn-helix domain-containing protein [Rhizobium mesoamericanum]|uniref:Helix-turn-helix domain-containing protein n=1 Tax=Rhizobium mesoamericanum STM3625 TaxID=1211777 RepID=K0PNE4_9HYPH|nr:helix-turn-helix domain-containing protein [Rhizobium mesoamericanum]CCM78041.1 hypothetical protein BN77_1016 [Rhizobium mesoamericanum STM3625]
MEIILRYWDLVCEMRAMRREIRELTAAINAFQQAQSIEVKEVDKLALSIPEAAHLAGLSTAYAKQLIYSGAIKSMKVGKRRLILAESLKESLLKK